jgi:hypothetical protein
MCGLCIAGKNKTLLSKQKNLNILTRKNLSLKTEYTKSADVHDFVCNICGYTWSALLSSVIKNPHNGCKSCSGLLPLTNESIDYELTLRSDKIIRLGNIVNATTKILWECEFGHIWEAVPDSIINAGSGCKICNNRGIYSKKVFDRNTALSNKPAILYLLRFTHIITSNTFLKVGITTRPISHRFAGYTKYNITTILLKPNNLRSCWESECSVLQQLTKFKYLPESTFGGRTECFVDTPEIEQQILNIINDVNTN